MEPGLGLVSNRGELHLDWGGGSIQKPCSIRNASRIQEDEAREQSLEECTESIVEESLKITTREIGSVGEGITSTMISLLEDLGNKLQQINLASQDKLKDQTSDIKSAICSTVT